MTMNIGSNIRRLRNEKGMTQEQLASRMGVTSAAVSKWESGQSLPDITMVMPLARVFEVTTDELMGYDAAVTEAEVDVLLERYTQLEQTGHLEHADELIRQARVDYPSDYRIMNRYMWHLVGGSADNDPAILLKNEKELTVICDCIEDGCRDPHLRFEAITMRAKLLHAAGNTEKAVAILQALPSFYQTVGQKTEQLFAKDTPEYRYWNHRNLIELVTFAVSKLFRSVWFDNTLDVDTRLAKAEALGDLFAEMRGRNDHIVLAIMEHQWYAALSMKAARECEDTDTLLRVTEKLLYACEALTDAAKTDEVLAESMMRSYHTTDLVAWTVNDRKTSGYFNRARLRENADYMALLDRFDNKG